MATQRENEMSSSTNSRSASHDWEANSTLTVDRTGAPRMPSKRGRAWNEFAAHARDLEARAARTVEARAARSHQPENEMPSSSSRREASHDFRDYHTLVCYQDEYGIPRWGCPLDERKLKEGSDLESEIFPTNPQAASQDGGFVHLPERMPRAHRNMWSRLYAEGRDSEARGTRTLEEARAALHGRPRERGIFTSNEGRPGGGSPIREGPHPRQDSVLNGRKVIVSRAFGQVFDFRDRYQRGRANVPVYGRPSPRLDSFPRDGSSRTLGWIGASFDERDRRRNARGNEAVLEGALPRQDSFTPARTERRFSLRNRGQHRGRLDRGNDAVSEGTPLLQDPVSDIPAPNRFRELQEATDADVRDDEDESSSENGASSEEDSSSGDDEDEQSEASTTDDESDSDEDHFSDDDDDDPFGDHDAYEDGGDSDGDFEDNDDGFDEDQDSSEGDQPGNNSNHSATTESANFFSLPPELRLQVYNHVNEPLKTSRFLPEIDIVSISNGEILPREHQEASSYSWLLINSQTLEDGLGDICKTHTLVFYHLSGLKTWLPNMTMARSVCLQFIDAPKKVLKEALYFLRDLPHLEHIEVRCTQTKRKAVRLPLEWSGFPRLEKVQVHDLRLDLEIWRAETEKKRLHDKAVEELILLHQDDDDDGYFTLQSPRVQEALARLPPLSQDANVAEVRAHGYRELFIFKGMKRELNEARKKVSTTRLEFEMLEADPRVRRMVKQKRLFAYDVAARELKGKGMPVPLLRYCYEEDNYV